MKAQKCLSETKQRPTLGEPDNDMVLEVAVNLLPAILNTARVRWF